jgi:ribonucleoside-diphosphate reductase alpha chain
MKGSIELAKRDGPYDSFAGSPFSQGKLQFDLAKEFDGVDLNNYLSSRWDWDSLRKDLVQYGARNSMLTALMPTASSAQIMNNSECFEPVDSCIFKRKVLSGEFMVINKYLVQDLIKLGLWNKDMKDLIIAGDGSIQNIESIPDNIKSIYKNVWEISMKSVINLCSDRQLFVDQMMSMNLFMKNPTFKKLSSMLMYSWKSNLKTGMYYLRSTSSAQATKFSVDPALEQQLKQNVASCSIDDSEECIACSS